MEASRWEQKQFGRVLEADLYQSFGLTTRMCLVSLIGIDRTNILINPPALYSPLTIAIWTSLGYIPGLPYSAIKGRFEAHHILPTQDGAVTASYKELLAKGYSWERTGVLVPSNIQNAYKPSHTLRRVQLSGVYLWDSIHEGLPHDQYQAGEDLIDTHFRYMEALAPDFGNARLRRDGRLILSKLEEYWEERWHTASESDFDGKYTSTRLEEIMNGSANNAPILLSQAIGA